MGISFSCGKETDIPEPRVEAFMRWGNRLESTNNLIAAIKAYKKAKEICHNRLVLEILLYLFINSLLLIFIDL